MNGEIFFKEYGITIVLEGGMFGIVFSPNDFIKDIDLKHGQIILRKRIRPKKVK